MKKKELMAAPWQLRGKRGNRALHNTISGQQAFNVMCNSHLFIVVSPQEDEFEFKMLLLIWLANKIWMKILLLCLTIDGGNSLLPIITGSKYCLCQFMSQHHLLDGSKRCIYPPGSGWNRDWLAVWETQRNRFKFELETFIVLINLSFISYKRSQTCMHMSDMYLTCGEWLGGWVEAREVMRY